MQEPIQLKEFEPLDKEKWVELGINDRLLNNIERFNKRQRKKIMSVGRDWIKATSYVGVFSVGKKTIQILPKISKDTENTQEDYAVRNLLYMLAYTKTISITQAELSRLYEREKAKFFEIIIYLYASNLIEQLKKDFRKNYIESKDNLQFLKGRILFQENFKTNIHQKHKIFCSFSDFSEKTILNQIFKYTSWLLSKITTDPQNFRLLKEIDFILSDIPLKRIRLIDFEAVHLDRLNYGYKPLVDLAKLFISNSTVELSCDRLESFSFLFDMSILFEQFIAGFIIKHKNALLQSDLRVKRQDKSKYLVDRPKSLFLLKPDIILFSKDSKLIIDTKYKILDPDDKRWGVAQSDLYQMLAYSLKHNCTNIVLLYPAHLIKQPPKEPYEIEHDEKTIRIFIRTINLNIDMHSQQHLILDELKSICSIINSEKKIDF
jgi:5-methylcytosine-specific restriction enzyme subunit McrC